LDLDKYGPVPTASDPDFVVCPECGSEFQPHIKVCIDCGAATVPPGAARTQARDRPGDGPSDESDEESDENEIAIRTEELEWIEDLQALFERHGIASRIEALPSSRRHHSCKILVAKQDALRASELDLEFLRERLGDDGADLVELPPAGDSPFCPFCSSKLPAGTVECPGCRLRLGESNLEVVKDFYEALREQDRDRILHILDPNVEWIQNEGFPGGGRHTGAETVLNEVFAALAAEWKTWQAEVGRWLDAGESIIALGAYRGTHRRTGRSMTAAFAHVYWLRDGQITRFEQYADTAEVVAACLDD
jgi:ketosteroid isomerase-like protein/ribosomal protein L32